MIVAGTCSPVDRACVTAMPGVATSAMAKITPKQTALGCSCKWNVGTSRRNYQKHDAAPLSLYNRSTTLTFLTIKPVVRKNQKKRRLDGLMCLGKAVLGQGGGGVQQLGGERENVASPSKIKEKLPNPNSSLGQ